VAGAVFRAAGVRASSAGAASIAAAKPTVDGGNGLLLCVVTSKNNATHATATPGWTLVAQVNSGASFTASLWKAAESAGAPTFTWTGSVACSAQMAYYSDPANVVSTTLGPTSSNTGTTSPHSTTAINTTKANALVVYIDVAAANTGLATPAGWTEDNDNGSATDAGQTTFGSKAVATSGTSSGAISVTGAAAAWVQWQLEIDGTTAPSPSIQFSKAATAAWLDATDGANFSKVELGAWLDAPSEADFSKVELGVWLDSAGARRRQSCVIN
jgi:hypothetical protein